MPKGVAQQALANSGTAQNLSNTTAANASNIYGGLEPTLQAEAAHPMGYTPQQKALMNTAGQQSAGGGNAGAIGEGKLYAARTKNAGGAKSAVSDAIRNSGKNLSSTAVGTELSNANLQQKQQQAGIGGLQGLYNTNLGASENALGISNQSLGVADQADANNPYMRLLMQGIQSGGQVAGAYLGKG